MTWTAAVHPELEVIQILGGNQVTRDREEAECEIDHRRGTWMYGGVEMKILTASEQKQRNRVSGWMNGLVQPPTDPLKPIFPRLRLQGYERSANDQKPCSIPLNSSFSL